MGDRFRGGQKEKALIIGAAVVGMKRAYRIHLPRFERDVTLVSDEHLEEIAEDDTWTFL